MEHKSIEQLCVCVRLRARVRVCVRLRARVRVRERVRARAVYTRVSIHTSKCILGGAKQMLRFCFLYKVSIFKS